MSTPSCRAPVRIELTTALDRMTLTGAGTLSPPVTVGAWLRRHHPVVESSRLIEPPPAALAQLVEHRPCKANVESSSLSRGSIPVGASTYRRLMSISCLGWGVALVGRRLKVFCSNACQQSHRRRLLLAAWL